MYENNSNNENNSQSGNYREYYYTAGTTSGTPPKKSKKQRPFLKKAAAFICLGALFGVTAGAAFSIPAYFSTKELKQTRAEMSELKEEISNNNSTAPAISSTTDSLSPSNASNTAFDSEQASANTISAIAQSCLPSVVSITNKGVTEVRTMFGTYQQDTESSGSGIIIGENDTELLIVTNYHVISGSNELSVVFS